MPTKNSFGSYDPRVASDFIKRWEGRELKAYRCSAGKWTIGFGHTEDVEEGDAITSSEAELLLIEDLRERANALAPFVNVGVTEGQYIALLSLAFNIGVGALKKSSLLRYLNLGRIDEAADEFLRWVYAGGKVSKGLQRRRESERRLFLEVEK